ncbi:hypothetical protein JTE90_019705 [Oedothorax gibbosus]|uniref:G2/mitotic-specific cyclin-B3 n=1 Tax=Oedothorax gibbosus TaxID=931172 RepID=A0AAV6U4Q5_9ARAC|nr:hypothetical protein JTE90_019705 [Oedothorax gibbosus]
MESIANSLRSAKLLQENSHKLVSKDASKRLGDALPDTRVSKRTLGDITNRTFVTSNANKGKQAKTTTKAGVKTKASQVSQSVSENEKPITRETRAKSESAKSSSGSESSMYLTAMEINDSAIEMDVSNIKELDVIQKDEVVKPVLPKGVEDYDATCTEDIYSVAEYVSHIFKYYREREKLFVVKKYLDHQPDITRSMRSILVDWMVEVQESFELNHETLYLAVKLVDFYLMSQTSVKKAKLQLVGATAVFIAAKFDERMPPLVDDFLFICDDSYTRQELLDTEVKILRTVNFDLGIPLSYRFLRRYARCSRISMEMLTLARFILETSLMDYDQIEVADSKIAAASLLLALRMKNQTWSPTLEYYTGYREAELEDVLFSLNQNISGPPNKHLQTIRTKYSHPIFFEVAKVPALKLPKREVKINVL